MHFSRGCFKAKFAVHAGDDFQTVRIPFNDFSDTWSPATGELTKKCSEGDGVCPTAKDLAAIQRMDIWAEGSSGKFHLEIQRITADPGEPRETAPERTLKRDVLIGVLWGVFLWSCTGCITGWVFSLLADCREAKALDEESIQRADAKITDKRTRTSTRTKSSGHPMVRAGTETITTHSVDYEFETVRKEDGMVVRIKVKGMTVDPKTYDEIGSAVLEQVRFLETDPRHSRLERMHYNGDAATARNQAIAWACLYVAPFGLASMMFSLHWLAGLLSLMTAVLGTGGMCVVAAICTCGKNFPGVEIQELGYTGDQRSTAVARETGDGGGGHIIV
jgi:hypothetical protein